MRPRLLIVFLAALAACNDRLEPCDEDDYEALGVSAGGDIALRAVGDSLRLTPFSSGDGCGTFPHPRDVLLRSDDPRIATVDSLGMVRAIAVGATRITGQWRRRTDLVASVRVTVERGP